MARINRPSLAAEAAQHNRAQLAALGSELRASRRRRRLTQRQLAGRAGVSQTTVSRSERGLGRGATLDSWQRVFTALGRRLTIEAARDPVEEPRDAGHLKLQELVLRLGRQSGYTGMFELQIHASDRARSTDVGLRDDRRRLLVLVECWNVIGDIGAAARSTTSKVQEADAFAIAIGGERPHRVASCWVARATRRNRELVARYPAVFAARFPSSSQGWVRALMTGASPPEAAGFVWADVNATRIYAWRRGQISRS